MVVFDHIRKTVIVICHASTEADDLELEFRRAADGVDEICRQLQRRSADIQMTDVAPVGEPTLEFDSNFTRSEFEDAVEKCKEYIRAGDIFQVVISQRLQLEFSSAPENQTPGWPDRGRHTHR